MNSTRKMFRNPPIRLMNTPRRTIFTASGDSDKVVLTPALSASTAAALIRIQVSRAWGGLRGSPWSTYSLRHPDLEGRLGGLERLVTFLERVSDRGRVRDTTPPGPLK